MPSLKTSVAVLASVILAISVKSQAVYYIDPTSVPLSTRTGWCQSQMTTCPLLCLQLPGSSATTVANDCDATTLAYDCICGNGMTPNASEFSQTLPYFLCTEYGNQCVAGCGGNTVCQSACRTNHPCGAQNPTRVNITSSKTSATTLPAGATSGTAGVVYNGIGATATSASTTKKSGSETVLDMGRSYSLLVMFTGIFAGFALVM